MMYFIFLICALLCTYGESQPYLVDVSIQRPPVLNVSEFDYYCNNSSYGGGAAIECFDTDGPGVFEGVSFSNIFITTRQTQSEQSYNQTQDGKTPWITKVSRVSYILGIEKYTIRFYHSIFYKGKFVNNDQMNGVLINSNGVVLKKFGMGMDILSLNTLLSATEIGLDSLSQSRGHDPGETIRHSGVFVQMEITYSYNTTSGLSYVYKVYALPGTECKRTKIRYIDSLRQLDNRHGVCLNINQSFNSN